MPNYPVVYAIREAGIQRGLSRQIETAKTDHFSIPYDRNRIIPVLKSRYRDPQTRALADQVVERLRRIETRPADERFTLFSALADKVRARKSLRVRTKNDIEFWRIVLLEWTKATGASRGAFEKEGLGRAFVETNVRPRTPSVFVTLFEEDYFEPVPTKEGLVRAIVELQGDKDFDDLFYEFAPVVVSLLSIIIPFGSLRLVGAALELVLGLFDLLINLHQMNSDGVLTDKEMEEAWWNLAGVFPIKFVQLVVFARTGYVIGKEMLPLLYKAVEDLYEHMLTLYEVRQAGWSHSVRYDPETAIFLPDFAVPDGQ